MPLGATARAQFHYIPLASAMLPRATRASSAIVHRTSYFVHRRCQAPPSSIVHRTSYMGRPRLPLPLCNHPRSWLQDIPSAFALPNPAQALQSYIVHRKSYIGRPRLPPSSIVHGQTPSAIVRSRFHNLASAFASLLRATRASSTIVHRTSYFVHRRCQAPPSYIVLRT